MMSRPALGATLAILLATTLGTGPVSAAHGGIHPSFETQRVYFTCPGPVSNAGGWSTSLPGSVVFRNGCGDLIDGTDHDLCQPGYDCVTPCRDLSFCRKVPTTFTGSFRGNLRDLTLELHLMAPAPARLYLSLGIYDRDGKWAAGRGFDGSVAPISRGRQG